MFTHDENVGIACVIGLTAEKVAQRWKISRQAQDELAYASHTKALQAQQAASSRPKPRRSR